MSKLTEHTVLARTRAQDLKSVRKLNAWGSELTDVSIVKNLPNVEVLSLSVNGISTLQDFSHCNNLQELYLRKNNITDLSEIRYLQDLRRLRNLWLADNPCAESEQYRLTVLRALPQLQKLDNITVHPEEVESAKIHGSPLEAIQNTTLSPQSPVAENCVQYEDSFLSEMHTSSSTVVENTTATSARMVTSHSSPLDSFPPKLEETLQSISKSQYIEEVAVQNQHKESEQNFEFASHQYNNICPENQNNSFTGRHLATNVEEPRTPLEPEMPPFEKHVDNDRFIPRSNFTPPSYATRTHPRSDRISPFRMLPKGGKNRNANILSAVLCLIKELDWPSLEVVDTAIHCQMEEMEAEQNSA